jgi:hypothetical protein
MAVSITWSETQGGAAISAPLNHGTASTGSNTTAKNIWLEHDGANDITGCGFILTQYSGTYTGGATAALDKTELTTTWPSGSGTSWGGVLINMDADGAFPAGNWPTVSTPQPSLGATFTSSIGADTASKVTLQTSMGAAVTSNGTIAAANDDTNFQMRMQVPSDEGTLGVRQFDLKLRYTFTS